MRRFLVGLGAFLLIISCTPHWSVHQINTKNVLINVQTGSVDSLVQSIVIPYRDSIEHDMSKLVTVSSSPLIKDKPESKLTSLIADILLESGLDYCVRQHVNVTAAVSYVNYGGLRASLPQGDITVGRIFELMPFENEVVLIRISGEALLKMAERIAARGGEGIAGMKLGIRDQKPSVITIGGEPLDTSLPYWLVTNDYIANGGDQMSMFLNPLQRIDTRLKLRDVLIQTLSNRYKNDGNLDVKLDGRIYNE
jgi:2',3'-cyclic-nucleotide 2'-phosphodiesterase (5'-nucleotidase family)